MSHHCQRLVWGILRSGKITALFRPLPDGSLTDAADDPVTVEPQDSVCVAHECQVAPEQSARWRQHLKDYEVEPLFEQFGRRQFELSPDRKEQTELEDFRGHVLEAFKFRGRATKLGYTRGQAQDAGWFYEYTKRFPTLGIEATLEFTGNSLPEENRPVAITSLHFERIGPDARPLATSGGSPSAKVPPSCSANAGTTSARLPAKAPALIPTGKSRPNRDALNMATQEQTSEPRMVRPPAETVYAEELAALAANDQAARAPGWKLSPRAVRQFVIGGDAPLAHSWQGAKTKTVITQKFYGDDALVERCIVTLLGNRGLLLVGEPGTAKSMLSELLAAAISRQFAAHHSGHRGHDRRPD